MPDGLIRYWQSMTTVEAGAAAERDPVLILPLAATEQHGPHLPLSTDLDIGMGLLAGAFGFLPSDFPAWVLPPQAVGASAEHARFPGTLSISAEHLVRMIEEQGRALADSGVRRLVLSNSHGGNRHAMDAAGLRLRQECGMLVVKANYFQFDRPSGVDLPDSEWRQGFHGGAVETAMMLHLHPGRVRTNDRTDAPSLGVALDHILRRLRPEGQASFSWLGGDLHSSGVTGDARLATVSKGEQLVEHYARALADVIQDALDFPMGLLKG